MTPSLNTWNLNMEKTKVKFNRLADRYMDPQLKHITVSVLIVLSLTIWLQLYNIKSCPWKILRDMCALFFYIFVSLVL